MAVALADRTGIAVADLVLGRRHGEDRERRPGEEQVLRLAAADEVEADVEGAGGVEGGPGADGDLAPQLGAEQDDVFGRLVFEWLPGRFFLQQRVEIDFQGLEIRGLEVIGFDVDAKRVEQLASGRSHVEDVSDEEWEFAAPYLTLMREDAPQREHPLREVFNALRWLAKNGRVLWVEATSVVICDQAGRPVGMRGVTMDITARKEAEQRFAEEFAFRQAIENSMPAGVAATIGEPDTAAVIASVNQALDAQELVKAKFHALKDQKKELAPQLAARTDSVLVHRVGNVVVLYRQQADAAKRNISV